LAAELPHGAEVGGADYFCKPRVRAAVARFGCVSDGGASTPIRHRGWTGGWVLIRKAGRLETRFSSSFPACSIPGLSGSLPQAVTIGAPGIARLEKAGGFLVPSDARRSLGRQPDRPASFKSGPCRTGAALAGPEAGAPKWTTAVRTGGASRRPAARAWSAG
jgi:hypothetical protein